MFVLLYTQERGQAASLTRPRSTIFVTQPAPFRSASGLSCPGKRRGRRDALPHGRPEALRYMRSSFSSRIPVCQSGDAGATPAGRTIFTRAARQQRSRESKSQPAPGSTEAACHFHKGPSFNRRTAALQAADAGA